MEIDKDEEIKFSPIMGPSTYLVYVNNQVKVVNDFSLVRDYIEYEGGF